MEVDLMAKEGSACRLRGGEHVAEVIDLADQADTRSIE